MKGKYTRDLSETSPKYLLSLVAVLTGICVLVALLLAAVNALTDDKITQNTAEAKEKAVLDIFAAGDGCELYADAGAGEEVYLVYKDGDILGYCAFVKTSGFGGDIELMVGIASDYTTAGVSIVSMSETPGVGSKTNSSGFLGQFRGGQHDSPTQGFDAISGATISSNAIAAGVEAAHGIGIDLDKIAEEKGVAVVLPSEVDAPTDGSGDGDEPPETEAPPETDAPSAPEPSEPAEPTPAEPTPAEPTPAEPAPDAPVWNENHAYGENGGDPSYRYDRFAETADDEYRIELTPEQEAAEPEEDETGEETGGTGA